MTDNIITSSFGLDRTALESSWYWEPVWESAKRICLDRHLDVAPIGEFATPVFSERYAEDGSRCGQWTSKRKAATDDE